MAATKKNSPIYGSLALDFAFTAVFTALAVSLWRGKRDILPWVGTAIFAILAEKVLPGKWYIVIGGVGGALLHATWAFRSYPLTLGK